MVLAFPGRRAQCPVHLSQVSIRIRMSNRSSIMDHSSSLSLSILSCAGVDGTKYTWSTFGCGWISSRPCSHSLSQAGSSPSPLHLRLSKFLSKVDYLGFLTLRTRRERLISQAAVKSLLKMISDRDRSQAGRLGDSLSQEVITNSFLIVIIVTNVIIVTSSPSSSPSSTSTS